MNDLYLVHHGILGQKWGVRRFQNEDGSVTPAGAERYYVNGYSVKKQTVGEIKDQHRKNIESIKTSGKSEQRIRDDLKKEDTLYKDVLADKEKYEKNKAIAKKVLITAGVVAVAGLAAYGIYKYSKAQSANKLAEAAMSKIADNEVADGVCQGLDSETWLTGLCHDKSFSGNGKLFTDSLAGNSYNTKNLFDKRVWDNLSENERHAIKAYTGPFYSDINGLLRMPDGYKTEYDEKQIRGLIDSCEKALSKSQLKEDTILHRGIGSTTTLCKLVGGSPDDLKNPDFLSSKIGSFITEDGFCSTGGSTEDAWAGVKMHIVAPKGTRGMYVDPISAMKGEHECLLQRGTTFEISKFLTDAEGNVTDVMVKVVDQLQGL